ncbi:MAG: HEPN domain-containing protein [Methanosarcinales archaeon]
MDSAEKTAFLCQQSVEKALKALYIHRLKESPGATHSLIFLGRKVSIPEEYFNTLRRLSPDFVITRYPNAAHAIPYELYDEKIANERLELSKKVIEWVKKELKK